MSEKQHVGILIGNAVHEAVKQGRRTRHERIDFYVEACRTLGLTPCFFRIQDIHFGNETVRAWTPRASGGYARARMTLPSVIHNRTLFFRKTAKAKLRRLNRVRTVFNGGNRYGKLKIHELLMEDIVLRPHLPGTLPATTQNVKTWMEQYEELIVKPDSSSIGRGVMKLERCGSDWIWRKPLGTKGTRIAARRFGNRLPAALVRELGRRRYIVQQRLPLATYQGRPFDLRISVQRDGSGQWQVTGMAAKVAAPRKFVTNVAQGGKVHRLETILQDYPMLDPELVQNDLRHYALRVAEHLGNRLPRLADLGLDVGLTEHGFPVFIECNGRDLRYSFKEAGMYEQWQATYANPMAYASYLLNRANG